MAARRNDQKRQKRGTDAKALVSNPTFTEALKWVSESSVSRFKLSKTPGECWEARLALQAADDFATILLAYIKDGVAAAKAAEKKRGKLRTYEIEDRKAYDKYLAEARKARKEFEEIINRMAPIPEASDGHA